MVRIQRQKIELIPFQSKVHTTKIDFLNADTLTKLWNNQSNTTHTITINQIKDFFYIWGSGSGSAKLLYQVIQAALL